LKHYLANNNEVMRDRTSSSLRPRVEHIFDRARADGFRAMQLNAVVETNTRAVALWRSLGMEVMATLPEGFHHPAHGYVGLHIMYRRLRPSPHAWPRPRTTARSRWEFLP
jgi:hypothetical protein